MDRTPFKGLYLFFCGICMGMADLIPGISGGTIAFIMGFYGQLLESLKSLNIAALKLFFTGRWHQFFKQVEWKFLSTLVAGIACAFFLFAGLIHFILGHELYRVNLYAAFLGLILASFYFCIRQINAWSFKEILGLAVGCLLAYSLTSTTLTPDTMQGPYAVKISLSDLKNDVVNYDAQMGLLTELSKESLTGLLIKKNIDSASLVYDKNGRVLGEVSQIVDSKPVSFLNAWLIICGAIAICALLLPGISGSYLLTLLGVYPLVIGSLADWILNLKQGIFDFESFKVLSNIGFGVILGAILFARALSWLLKKYPGLSLAILSGFMIGALRSVWPFWTYQYVLWPLKLEKGPQLVAVDPIFPVGDVPHVFAALLWALAGFLLVLGIEYIATRKAAKLS